MEEETHEDPETDRRVDRHPRSRVRAGPGIPEQRDLPAGPPVHRRRLQPGQRPEGRHLDQRRFRDRHHCRCELQQPAGPHRLPQARLWSEHHDRLQRDLDRRRRAPALQRDPGHRLPELRHRLRPHRRIDQDQQLHHVAEFAARQHRRLLVLPEHRRLRRQPHRHLRPHEEGRRQSAGALLGRLLQPGQLRPRRFQSTGTDLQPGSPGQVRRQRRRQDLDCLDPQLLGQHLGRTGLWPAGYSGGPLFFGQRKKDTGVSRGGNSIKC